MEDQSESADAEIVTYLLRGAVVIGLLIAAGHFVAGTCCETFPPLHPRQLSDCYFETGHSSVNPMPEIERRGHAVLYMLCVVRFCVMCGLFAHCGVL